MLFKGNKKILIKCIFGLSFLFSICDLLTDIAALPDTEQNDKLIKEVTKKLWDYAIYNSDVDVNFSAYQALESFSLVQVSYHLSDVINESGDLAKPDNFGFVPGQLKI